MKRPSSVPEDLFNDLIKVCLDLVERYVPWALKIPYESWTGLRWLPKWSSSPVKDSAFGVSGAKKTPFHLELFAVSL